MSMNAENLDQKLVSMESVLTPSGPTNANVILDLFLTTPAGFALITEKDLAGHDMSTVAAKIIYRN